MPSTSRLIQPIGGTLVNLIVAEEAQPDLRARATYLPSLQLSERALYDLELMAIGGFSPLDRFMNRADYERMLAEMRLDGGQLFPILVMLLVERNADVRLDREVALRDARNELLGIMTVEEAYEWDRAETAQQVRLGVQQRGSGHQYPAHRLRRFGDRPARRSSGGRRGESLPCDTRRGASHGRGGPLRRGLRGYPIGCLRAARQQGVYAKARRGEITAFTGIDDPYEAPENPEITLDTVVSTPEQNARRVLEHLERQGFVR